MLVDSVRIVDDSIHGKDDHVAVAAAFVVGSALPATTVVVLLMIPWTVHVGSTNYSIVVPTIGRMTYSGRRVVLLLP